MSRVLSSDSSISGWEGAKAKRSLPLLGPKPRDSQVINNHSTSCTQTRPLSCDVEYFPQNVSPHRAFTQSFSFTMQGASLTTNLRYRVDLSPPGGSDNNLFQYKRCLHTKWTRIGDGVLVNTYTSVRPHDPTGCQRTADITVHQLADWALLPSS